MKAMFHGSVPENHDARLAYDYYYLLGDWDSRNAVGVAPLKEMIDVVDGIKSLEDMTGYLVNTPGEDRLYRFWTPEARQNPEEPGSSMLSLKRSAFFLLDRAEYREMTDEGKYQIEVFTTFFQKMLAKLGYSEEEARQKIDNCFAWETMMNSVDPDEGKSDDSEFTNDIDRLYTRDELKALTPNVPLLETLEKAEGYPAMDKYFIPDSVYFERLNELYTEENLPLMRVSSPRQTLSLTRPAQALTRSLIICPKMFCIRTTGIFTASKMWTLPPKKMAAPYGMHTARS